MAEALVSTILQQLTNVIYEEVREDVRLLGDAKKEVKKLENNLRAIKVLLEDAEEKQMTDKGVKLWLDRLNDASLDMEDCLEEWRMTLQQRAKDGAENASFLQRKVCHFLQCFSFDRIVRHRAIARNIKEINERLDEIAKEKDRYQLSSKITKQPNRKESTSFTDESNLIGRDEIKKELISHLLCGTDNEEGSLVETISIVGMGGIGKTAVAQLIYNDQDVKEHFTSRVWVCVSENFDEGKVARAIIVGLEGLRDDAGYLLESVPLDSLLKRIYNNLKGKKYLLILDDVWTDNNQDFESLNLTFKCGGPGSRILVTTRKDTVAKMMKSSHTIHLEKLSEELCWSILCKIALSGRDKRSCEELESIAWRIVEKCNGLPLVAKTLGSLLQFKTTKKEWENVLNSEIWRFDMVHKDVFAPLLLSYLDLPSPVRQCFKYCAGFPKNRHILPSHLIGQWIAQGYLALDDDSSQLEQVAQGYFECLAARSFFQEFLIDHETRFCKFMMHDAVYDFVVFLTQNEFGTKVILKGDENLIINSEKIRHLRLITEEGVHFPSYISGAEKLRSLMNYSEIPVITAEAFRNLCNRAKRLRLLDMRMDGYDHSTIPEEIGNLLHLRYLTFSWCKQIKRLPKAFCRLYNMTILDFEFCTELEKLPAEMGNLVNLQVFRTSGCSRLTCYPKSFRRLTRLTRVQGLIVRADRDDPEEFSIGDLANLQQLLQIFMKVVGNTINVNEAKRVKLQNLLELKMYVPGSIEDDALLKSLNLLSIPDYTPASSYDFSEPVKGLGRLNLVAL